MTIHCCTWVTLLSESNQRCVALSGIYNQSWDKGKNHNYSIGQLCNVFAMMLTAILLVGVCALRKFGAEATIGVMFEDISIEKIDPQYFSPSETRIIIVEDDEGVTTIDSNLTVTKVFPKETQGHLKLLGLSMGSYNQPTGVDIEMGICEMLNEPILMGPFFSVLGFKKDACPPGPGFYSQQGYELPVDNLPDEFPENKYLAIFEIFLPGKPLISVNIFVDIENSADR